MDLIHESLLPTIKQWLEEDDLLRNVHYTRSLPDLPVKLQLKVKSELVFAGCDYFITTFVALGAKVEELSFLKKYEGKTLPAGTIIEFPSSMSFALALTGERLALNLLQHASSIATFTREHVKLAESSGIKLLDTRKTTPGLRSLEKYAVRVGGGWNHRLGQTDLWMIKDNHKTCLGGLKGAFEFFRSQGSFYNEIIAEIHDIAELQEAMDLGIRHVMLDNFSPNEIAEAVKMKKTGVTFEASGGIRFSTLKEYLVPGLDAISIGALTNSAPRVDISFKFRPL